MLKEASLTSDFCGYNTRWTYIEQYLKMQADTINKTLSFEIFPFYKKKMVRLKGSIQRAFPSVGKRQF